MAEAVAAFSVAANVIQFIDGPEIRAATMNPVSAPQQPSITNRLSLPLPSLLTLLTSLMMGIANQIRPTTPGAPTDASSPGIKFSYEAVTLMFFLGGYFSVLVIYLNKCIVQENRCE